MQSTKDAPAKCQLHTIPNMSEGLVDMGSLSLPRRIKLWLKRNLSAATKRKLKRVSSRFTGMFFSNRNSNSQNLPIITNEVIMINEKLEAADARKIHDLKDGDLVRIRSREEIEATLDDWNELKGCMVMKDMWQYCGTTQRILKVIERFVDERDYRLKKGKGLVLLQGLICSGTEDYGRCDRSCFYFWREEWLEKING